MLSHKISLSSRHTPVHHTRLMHHVILKRSTVCAAQAGAKETVKDVMTTGAVYTCRPDDSVDTALELLVEHGVTGLPVVDPISSKVVGVVSDFDLLALDAFGSTNSAVLFPEAEQTWQAFIQVRKVLAKGTGKKISDVMTRNPITVTPSTSIDQATGLLLQKRIRRLIIVDDEGHLLGLLSRRDIIKLGLEQRKQASASSISGSVTGSRDLF